MALSINDAAHKTVYAAGGPKVIAARLDASEAVIRAKANPNDESRWFYLPEAVELMSLTGDHRILESMADEFGYLLTQTPEGVDSADRALIHMVSDSIKGQGDEANIRRALASLKNFKGSVLRKKVNQLQAYLAQVAQAIDD